MKKDKIIMAHGSGGKRMDELIREVFIGKFKGSSELFLQDCFTFHTTEAMDWAFTTDSFVVDPLFFPGGDIGRIAVSGTVNDLAVSGAVPLYLSASFIIEEGFSINDLKKIVDSMAVEAKSAGVKIVTGDTKVVEKGKTDKLFINTTGIGSIHASCRHLSSGTSIAVGDIVLVSGNLGEHAVAVLCKREGITFESPVLSDVAPLNKLIQKVLFKPNKISFMRDITRGGLASITNEIVESRPFGIDLEEAEIPVPQPVQSFCDIFGYDPLHLANEGKILLIVKPSMAANVLEILQNDSLGKHAAIIGEITDKHPGKVYMRTYYKGTRVVEKLSGEQLPRIC